MQKRMNKLTVCALAVLLGIAAATYPVMATDTPGSQQTETQELDETSVPIGDTGTQADKTFTYNSEPLTDDFTDSAESKVQTRSANGIQPYATTNAGAFYVTPSSGWTYSDGVLTFNTSGDYSVEGDGVETTDRIVVSKDFEGTITLSGININTSAAPALAVANNTKLTINLINDNILKSTQENSAGLQFTDENCTLVIQGTGSLTAAGGEFGAGIGGGNSNSGNIVINGGNITATGAGLGYGAGIGGGNYGKKGNVTINGGTINASAGTWGGAPIGNTRYGSGSTVLICGGSIKVSYETDKEWSKRLFSPQNNDGKDLYLLKLDNLSGVNEVTVDNQKYTRNGDHPNNDGAFYLYLTGENHEIELSDGNYCAIWNGTDGFTVKKYTPTPTVLSQAQTASTITVAALPDQSTYGTAKYSLNNTDWQESPEFRNLKSGTSYTVYAKYSGNNNYLESDVGQTKVTTTAATYTISIPATPLTAGIDDSKAELKPADGFDLGYGGQVTVTVTNVTDGKLTLNRTTDNAPVNSVMLINGSPLGQSNTIAAFTMDNRTPISVSFAKPEEQTILAGDYKGTVTFAVSYTE